MLICIDYDDTFTLDRHLWRHLIACMQSSGHKVICCTMRPQSDADIVEDDLPSGVPVYYSPIAKAQYLAQQQVYPDIWIDDQPEAIGNATHAKLQKFVIRDDD